MNRCVNIDWLEVYCFESPSEPRTPDFFKSRGWKVVVRPYGTPQYAQMFTLYSQDGLPFLEIRRQPLSLRENGGIFDRRSTHIRLSNRACYLEAPIASLRRFLFIYDYEYKGITRIDIALDFIKFDNGAYPQHMIDSFMKGRISKINVCNIAAHGKDQWDGRYWNSLKWGSESSMITTKIYDKTLELSRDGHEKHYIKDQWQAAELCSLQTAYYTYKNGERRYKAVCVPFGAASKDPIPLEAIKTKIKIWRVEFAIKSEAKDWVQLSTGEYQRLNLSSVDNRQKLLFLFHNLTIRYFHFKKREKKADGTWQRKDRCTDMKYFKTHAIEHAYKPVRLVAKHDFTRTDKMVAKRLISIMNQADKFTTEEYQAAKTILAIMNKNIFLESVGVRHELEKAAPMELKSPPTPTTQQLIQRLSLAAKNKRFFLLKKEIELIAKEINKEELLPSLEVQLSHGLPF